MELNPQQILASLYDLALATTGETRVAPLLTKVMQRMLYHTGFACGIYLHPQGNSYLVETALCNRQLGITGGDIISLPAQLVEGPAALINDDLLLQEAFPQNHKYHVALRLPVSSDGVFLLLATTTPTANIHWPQVFDTILHNFSHTLRLCRDNERYICDLKQAQIELVAAKDKAEATNHAKSEFLTHMSHELRTPMNAILGFAQLLELDVAPTLDADKASYITEISRAGNHLLRLINEILDFARIESGKITISLENIALTELTKEAISLVEPIANNYKIKLFFDTRATENWLARADYTRLKQILINLLSNAIKYNKPGGYVRLSTQSLSRDTLRIIVEDNGFGLSPEEQQRLFIPFERLGVNASGIEGTGVGLTVTKKLVELMHGVIGIESEKGIGSRFWIDLPCTSAFTTSRNGEFAPATAAITPAVRAKGFTVLYIEDNPANLRLVEELLIRRNIKVLAAPDAMIGLDMVLSHRPDLILMDINLPGMSGYDALIRLRLDASTQSTPVIALSASATKHDVERGKRAGFAYYLTKPIDIKNFYAVIDRVLEER
jgi:signal transduction histidine kinase